jgi:hypothetical protein
MTARLVVDSLDWAAYKFSTVNSVLVDLAHASARLARPLFN